MRTFQIDYTMLTTETYHVTAATEEEARAMADKMFNDEKAPDEVSIPELFSRNVRDVTRETEVEP